MQEPFADRLPLSREAVDRDGAARETPGLLDALWADPGTRVLAVHGTRGLATADGRRLDLRAPAALDRPGLVLYLGRTREASADGPAGTAVLAAVVADPAAVEPDGSRWADLRLAGADLSARDAGLLTEAVALANWHRAAGFSPRTGVATVATKAGWVRHPPGFDEESSGEHVFPRTDPAIIVGVVDARDRLLLASNAAWPDGRFSVLAGFVEPGESFESAVEREVAEEVSVRVVGTRYLGSQPWPFPASVMVGFLATADPDAGDPVADGVEIREARWFSRDELAAAVEHGLKLPGHTSIARAIIEEWYGGRLAGDW